MYVFWPESFHGVFLSVGCPTGPSLGETPAEENGSRRGDGFLHSALNKLMTHTIFYRKGGKLSACILFRTSACVQAFLQRRSTVHRVNIIPP